MTLLEAEHANSFTRISHTCLLLQVPVYRHVKRHAIGHDHYGRYLNNTFVFRIYIVLNARQMKKGNNIMLMTLYSIKFARLFATFKCTIFGCQRVLQPFIEGNIIITI